MITKKKDEYRLYLLKAIYVIHLFLVFVCQAKRSKDHSLCKVLSLYHCPYYEDRRNPTKYVALVTVITQKGINNVCFLFYTHILELGRFLITTFVILLSKRFMLYQRPKVQRVSFEFIFHKEVTSENQKHVASKEDYPQFSCRPFHQKRMHKSSSYAQIRIKGTNNLFIPRRYNIECNIKHHNISICACFSVRA